MKLFILFAIVFAMLVGIYTEAAPNDKDSKVKFATEADFYAQPNSAVGIETLMGQRVKLEIVVKIARAVPLVEIVRQFGGADGAKPEPILANIVSISSTPGEWKEGQQFIIKGIVVDQGSNAYSIYLHEAQRPK